VTLNPDAACGDPLPLDLDVTHADGGNRSSFTLPVGLTSLEPVALDTPLSMPTFSASPTVSSIVIPEDLTIGDVNVTVDLTHEITEQVEITLTSPQGTMVVLHDRTPGVDVQTTFDTLTEPDGPGAMSDFDGESSQGTWTLSLLDDVIGLPITPGGTLNGWSLSIVAGGGAVCTPFSCGEAVPAEVAPDFRLSVQSGTDLRFDWPALGGAAVNGGDPGARAVCRERQDPRGVVAVGDPGKGGTTERRQLSACHRSVEGDQSGAVGDGVEQRGDVRVTDDDLGIVRQAIIVDAMEQAGCSVATAQTPHGVERRVGERAVEIVEALFIGAGEVTVAHVGVGSDDGLVSHGLTGRNRAVDVARFQHRARRSDQSDTASGLEGCRLRDF